MSIRVVGIQNFRNTPGWLSEIYVLGDQLRTIWQQPTVDQATSALDD